MAVEELTKKLAEKDHIIMQLRAGKEGATKDREVSSKKLQDLRNQIAGI